MKNTVKSFILFLATGLLTACTAFDELNINPDTASKVTPDLILTETLKGTFRFWNPNPSDYASANLWCKHTALIQDSPHGNQYYTGNYGGFDNFKKLTDLKFMAKFAAGTPEEPSYKAFALFYKAYCGFYYSLDFGDIPYSEAGRLEEGIMQPKYDKQADVFKQVLDDLKAAEILFAQGANFKGDFMMNGDAAKWRRFCNAMQLKVLQTMSKKATAQDKARFSEIITAGKLMTGNEDNFQILYTTSMSSKHPYWNGQYKRVNHAVSKMVIDALKEWKDRRLFYFADPAEALTAMGKSENDFDAYEGAPTEEVFETLLVNKRAGKYSLMNMRYTEVIDGDPKLCFPYAEQCFIIAEGIEEGWANGNSEEYYKKGVKAMLEYYMTFAKGGCHEMPITPEYINNYFTGAAAYASNKTDRLKQIWMQRWMADFFQATETRNYYQLLRTGYPKLPLNPKTSVNQDNPNEYPKRLKYPTVEQTTNLVNLQKAIDDQYGGFDSTMGIPWYLKD